MTYVPDVSAFTLDGVELVAIVGALQGAVLTVALATQRTNRVANGLLATLMAAMTIYLAAGPYYSTGAHRSYPHFIAVNYQTTWVFGPLVYLYARAASNRASGFTPGNLIHFTPVAVTTIAAMPFYLLGGSEKIATWEQWSVEGVGGLLAYLDPFKYLSGIVYSAAAAAYLARHRREVEQSYSNVERVNLRWLLWLTAATGSIWVVVTLLRITQVSSGIRDGYVAIAMAFMVYGIGYKGLRQPEIFRYDRTTLDVPRSQLTLVPEPAPQSPTPRYDHSGLGEDEAVRLKKSLTRLMDTEQPWKESELTLADLAGRLNTVPYKLSEVLNGQLGQTFHDFVNGYRVREVQRRIRAGDARSLKLLALAMDAGFASKSAFNEAFKKHTSQTPSAFRQTIEVA
jgi:AraC-like DNA-binding protein